MAEYLIKDEKGRTHEVYFFDLDSGEIYECMVWLEFQKDWISLPLNSLKEKSLENFELLQSEVKAYARALRAGYVRRQYFYIPGGV